MRSAECGMRNVKGSVMRRTTIPFNSAFRIPHSALCRIGNRDSRSNRACPSGTQSDLQGLDSGGGAPHADEQPRSGRGGATPGSGRVRSEEHTSELQSLTNLVCRLLLEKKKTQQ